ncbi:MAG: class I SAM-dependent methyltransferase [Calditrichaeota bacterium]|nr:class I SAM-dependent methyltransferase [Calditrichota bacterium]
MIKEQMENIYKNMPLENIPWNIDAPPEILQDMVQTEKVKPCKALEMGCGTGNYVIFLAGKDFIAKGVDISTTAIEIAKKTAVDKKVKCQFIAADVLGEMTEVRDKFGFIYDWELLHHIFPEDRVRYVSNVYRLLNKGGHYLSVCFSEDSPQFGGVGKYRKTPLDTKLYFSSESEIASLFKPLFEIEELKTVEIKGKFTPHKAIYAFLMKR